MTKLVGRAGTMTHNDKRKGPTTLCAAFDCEHNGELIGKWFSRHRREEFRAFLRMIDREVEKGKDIHMILDNDSTHRHLDVLV